MAAPFEIEADICGLQPHNLNVLDSNISYNTFFQMYMKNNFPCIIKNIGLDWGASKNWIKENTLNFAYLLEHYGNNLVTIYDCNHRHYNSQKTQISDLKTYINSWDEMKEKLYYLKDWHLQNESSGDRFYEVPVFFASDWLNEFLCENEEDDYRFVYMGPMGTWTPFHADVFTSYSWSINICGQKRWLLFPPGEENKLRDGLNNLPYDLEHVTLANSKHFEVVQNTNEVIFIPSGWHHQVWNTKDTISINHNWINGCNIKNVWHSLESALVAVKKEIEDCQDMDNFEEHCQVMLRASYGLDFLKFYQFLKYISVKRINLLENNVKIISFDRHELGRTHALFDLESIKCVLQLLVDNSITQILNTDKDYTEDNLLDVIHKCIDNKS